MLSFEPQHLSLLILLLTTLGTSAVGVLYPNLITQPNRSHNTEKLLNEIFARQHLAYTGFHLSVMIVAKFQSPNEWMARLLSFFVIISLILFGVGLKTTTTQNSKIGSHHVCPADNCTQASGEAANSTVRTQRPSFRDEFPCRIHDCNESRNRQLRRQFLRTGTTFLPAVIPPDAAARRIR